ncbi:MAG: MarR family transcriptional regulator [Pseudomonadota bacterium]
MTLSERDALDFLKAAFTASVADDAPDLTARQSAILMVVALEAGPHTVRGLAARLDLSKPVITRALDKLEGLGLVRRVSDEQDLRSVFIERTQEGSAFLRAMVSPMCGGSTRRRKPAKGISRAA